MSFLSTVGYKEAIPNASRSAGSTAVNGNTIHTDIYTSAAALIEFGAITTNAVTSIKWQGSEDNSTWHDLKDTKLDVADTDDNKYFVNVLSGAMHKYVRVVISRGTANATIRSGWYILGDPHLSGTANPGEIAGTKVTGSPEFGTA